MEQKTFSLLHANRATATVELKEDGSGDLLEVIPNGGFVVYTANPRNTEVRHVDGTCLRRNAKSSPARVCAALPGGQETIQIDDSLRADFLVAAQAVRPPIGLVA
jgi:hypothetical protein